MRKNENTAKSGELKKHLTISIDPENYDFIRKKRGIASNLVNEVLNGLRITTDNTETPNGVQFGVKLSKYGKIEWTHWDSNPRPPACKASRLNGLHSGKEAEFEEFENFNPSGEIAEIQKYPIEIDGREIRGAPGVSIGAFIADKEKRFNDYCHDTGTTGAVTRAAYFNALKGLTHILIPSDFIGLTLTKTESRALHKFYNFVGCDCLYNGGFNGYTCEQWTKNQQRTKNNLGTRSDQRTKDLTPEEVARARDKLEEPSYQVFYTLVGYSGARALHIYRWLENPERKIEHVNGVIRADVRGVADGTKKEAYLYFPAELEKAIIAYRHPAALATINKVMQTVGEPGRPVNLSSLRKWQFNILLDNMDRLYANAIQGRIDPGIDAKHYFDNAGKAAKWYPTAIADLEKGLPIPEWMKAGVWDMPKSKRYQYNRGASGLDRLGEKKRYQIVKLLEAGTPVKQIARKLKTSTVTVRKIRDGKR